MANRNKEALSEILKGIKYLINQALLKTTKCYDGIILSQNDNDKWTIKFNGESHVIKKYGNITPAIGMVVKVIIPQNNMSLAFFI